MFNHRRNKKFIVTPTRMLTAHRDSNNNVKREKSKNLILCDMTYKNLDT